MSLTHFSALIFIAVFITIAARATPAIVGAALRAIARMVRVKA